MSTNGRDSPCATCRESGVTANIENEKREPPGKATPFNCFNQAAYHSGASTWTFHIMDDRKLTSELFQVFPDDAISAQKVFLAHLYRFIGQGRDVSWREAPAIFAAISSGEEDAQLTNIFRTAMETFFDDELIFAEEHNGGSKIVVT